MTIASGFLLQTVSYFKEDDPQQTMIFGIAVGVIVVIAVVVNIVKRRRSAEGRTKRRFSKSDIHRIASSYQLNREQSNLLEYIFSSNLVTDPHKVMRETVLLDRHFETYYRAVERNYRSEEETQLKLAKLFELRNAIDAVPDSSGSITTTRKAAVNTPVMLSVDKNIYNLKVIESSGESLITEAPQNALGTPLNIKGAKVSITFLKGLSFETRFLNHVKTPKGPGLEFAHSQTLVPVAQRRFRRRQINVNCTFFLVFVDRTGSGRRKKPKLIVDKKRLTGTVLDISAGGCSIKTKAPVQIGSRLKIDINSNGLISVLGQALRINRSGATGTIIHIKFLKVPPRSNNNINACVYEYE